VPANTALSTAWRILTTIRNPWVYALNRAGALRRPFTYALWNGMRVRSRPFAVDRSVLNDVWIELSYEPSAYGIPFDWRACRTIIDVGANTGTFVLFAAARAPRATIHAIEPEPGNVSLLQENVVLNRLEQRVVVHPVAAGAASGTLTLHVAHQCSGGHSVYKYTEDSHPIEVRVRAFRDLLREAAPERCDFCKIDCEGAEYDILYSLTPEETAKLPFLAIETHHFSKEPRNQPAALHAHLRSLGYTVIEHRKSLCFAFRGPPKR